MSFRSVTNALIIGLALSGLGTVASAEPAAQAGPSATPTASSSAACVNPPQGVVVLVANPNPGDVLSPGSNVTVQGVAYDTASTAGPGIDRVSVYFGNRDAGGLFWGEALLGQPNPQAGTGPLSTAGFSVRSPTIPSGSGSRDIFVYAHSSITNREGVASVPVFLGAAPTPIRGQVPTAVLPPPPVCTPAPTATPIPTTTPIPVASTPTTPSLVSAATATPIRTLGVPTAPAPVAPAVATQAPLAPAAPAAVAPTTAVAPATATTAPRGGGIPSELGLLLLAAGALVVGGGYVARRRERRGAAPRH